MNEHDALLISWLNFGEKGVPRETIPEAIAALERLQSDALYLSRPAEPGDVLDALSTVAAVIQVELPEEHGLKAYVALLQEMPAHVLGMAVLEVLRRHTYRTMPLPAEFLATQAVKEWSWVKDWFPRFCGQHAERLRKQLDGTV